MTSGGNNFNNFFYGKTFIMSGQPSGWGPDFIQGARPPTGASAGFPMSP